MALGLGIRFAGIFHRAKLGGMATTLTSEDLTSGLVDLTAVPMDELRDLRTPALAVAIRRTLENAAFTTGNELQDQAR